MWLDPAFVDLRSIAFPAPQPGTPPPPRVRIGTGERLVRALLALAGPEAKLVLHEQTAWASITFAGSRHTVVLRFAGWEACDSAGELIANLPEHEFRLPGALVAEAAVTRVDQDLLPEPRMDVELSILLLDEG